MLKTILSTLVLAASLFSTNAQEIPTGKHVVSVSDPYPVTDTYSKRSFTNGEVVLTIKINDKNIFIQKFAGERLNFIAVKSLEYGKDFHFEKVIQIDGRVYLFYSLWDKKYTNGQLFKREISFETGDFTGPGERLLRTTKKTSPLFVKVLPGNMYSEGGRFSFKQSADKSNLSIRYEVVSRKKDVSREHDTIGLYVFDKNLQEIYHNEFAIPYTNNRVSIEDFALDKVGNGYFLAKFYRKEFKPLEERSNYSIQLLKVSADGSLTVSTIDTNGLSLSNVKLIEDQKGDIVCAAYRGSESGKDGISLIKMQTNGEVEPPINYQFSRELLNAYTNDSPLELNENPENKTEIEGLCVQDYVLLNDGSAILIGEVIYTTFSGSPGNTSTTYHRDALIVSKINSEGEVIWTKKIPKRKQGGSSIMVKPSFKYIHTSNYHYILFNDHRKNADISTNRIPIAHSDAQQGSLIAYTIDDKTGDMKRSSIFDMHNLNGIELFQFSTDRIVWLNDNTFAVEFYKKEKEDIMIKVELNEQ